MNITMTFISYGKVNYILLRKVEGSHIIIFMHKYFIRSKNSVFEGYHNVGGLK